jgi:ribokinase
VSTAHVTVDPDAPTGLAIVMLDADGDNAIVVVAGANATVSPSSVDTADFVGCDLVLAQLEVPLPAVTAALRRGASSGALTVLNAAPAMPLPDPLLGMVDVLVVNEHEAAEISGRSDVSAAATALLARGARAVVVTLGAAGALMLRDGDERLVVDGFPVRPVDTVGAGDCFVGALSVALAEKRPPADALRFANAAAAIAVTRPGAQDAMPTRAEVEAFQP